MMELEFSGKVDQPDSMGNHGQDISLFLPGTFDDVESHFFGQPHSYMMHQQGQPMVNVPSQMQDPASTMGMLSSQPVLQRRRSTKARVAINVIHPT
jgi:hypothetical protein